MAFLTSDFQKTALNSLRIENQKSQIHVEDPESELYSNWLSISLKSGRYTSGPQGVLVSKALKSWTSSDVLGGPVLKLFFAVVVLVGPRTSPLLWFCYTTDPKFLLNSYISI